MVQLAKEPDPKNRNPKSHTEAGQERGGKGTRRTQAGFSLKDLTAKSGDQETERTSGNLSLCTRQCRRARLERHPAALGSQARLANPPVRRQTVALLDAQAGIATAGGEEMVSRSHTTTLACNLSCAAAVPGGVLTAPPRQMRSMDRSGSERPRLHLVNTGWDWTSTSMSEQSSESARVAWMLERGRTRAVTRNKWALSQSGR